MTWLLGYLLGIVIDAVTQFQSRSAHKDPLHVTAHFLRPVSVGGVEIHVRRLRTGQGLTNLTTELVQRVRLVVRDFPCFYANLVIERNKNNFTPSIRSHRSRRGSSRRVARTSCPCPARAMDTLPHATIALHDVPVARSYQLSAPYSHRPRPIRR